MPVPVTDLQQPNISNIIELFELELNTAMHGATTVYRFHNGVNENNSNLIFNGNEYQKMPIQAAGFDFKSTQLTRPTITISNIFGTITTILLTLPQGLEGAKVTRIRTLEKYIDSENFPTQTLTDFIAQETTLSDLITQEDGDSIGLEVNASPHGTPDPTQEFPREIYLVDRKTQENREAVIFELAAIVDFQGLKIPKRQIIPNDFPGVGTFFS